jgi:hypothetical protein
MEVVEGRIVRPRQVRYQAALRPDKYCTIDSKRPSIHIPMLDSPKVAPIS